MRKSQKLKLINELVHMNFEKNRYISFLKEVLGGEIFEEISEDNKDDQKNKENKNLRARKDDNIQIELLGEIIQNEEKIGIFNIVYNKLNPYLDERRIQRKHMGNLLKTEYNGRYRKALVAFSSSSKSQWRLSLVELEDAFSSGVVTPVKMISHIMGQRGKNIAAFEMISLLTEKPKKKGEQGLYLVFDQEKLLEGFFKKFSEKFFLFRGTLENNKEICKVALSEGIEKIEIADKISKKIVTQLIVLYFIQKKSWIGASKDKKLEEGDPEFILNLYNSCIKGERNFYRDYLEPIFHKGFSKKREDTYIEELKCRVPYLNLMIFEPFLNKKISEISIEVENSFFYDDGSGILDLFSNYHFSLVENEPHLRDMVIDPEMVGNIFENLLDADYRRSKGTYYTPRDIVHFMCKTTLINYLFNNLEGVEEEEIKDFVFLSEFNWDEDRRRVKKQNFKNLTISTSIYSNLDKIEGALKRLKVVEPSIGSGAFLLGMLGELLKLRKVVDRYKKRDREKCQQFGNEDFLLKKEIIESNLYGVDLDLKAIESSKLRLWISLLADARADDLGTLLKSKKNLFQGNSITMEWKEKFHEVLGDVDKGHNRKNGKGFDIVIGNPPYVGEKGNKDIFREILGSPLGERFYMGRGDLFYFFFHLGFDILKDEGTLAYITTNYYITADGALKLREDIKKRTNILQMIDFNEIGIFSKAKGQHNIISIFEKNNEKYKNGRASLCESCGELTSKEMSLYLAGKYKSGSYSKLTQSEFYRGEKNYIYLEKNTISAILEKLLKGSIPLKEEVKVNQGLVSGADMVSPRHIENFNIVGDKGEGIFSLSPEEVKRLNLSVKEKEKMGMFFKNSHIDRYVSSEVSDREIIYMTKDDDLDEFTNISDHLTKYKNVLENKRETKNGRLPWYSLHWPREKEIFLGEKIVAPQRSRRNVFAYNNREWYASADVYYITCRKNNRLSLKYILALLNSKLYYVWLYKRGKRKGELLELYATPLEELPIKPIERVSQRKFEDIIDKIILMKESGVDTSCLEREIDEMTCDLYGLEEEEKKEIYDFYDAKLGQSS